MPNRLKYIIDQLINIYREHRVDAIGIIRNSVYNNGK